jgi:hypothetical protein
MYIIDTHPYILQKSTPIFTHLVLGIYQTWRVKWLLLYEGSIRILKHIFSLWNWSREEIKKVYHLLTTFTEKTTTFFI